MYHNFLRDKGKFVVVGTCEEYVKGKDTGQRTQGK
jgi:hypothetical protein